VSKEVGIRSAIEFDGIKGALLGLCAKSKSR
jgi:hypothetical protein